MDNRSLGRKIPLGVLGKPFGLKGYLYLRYLGNNPNGLIDFKEVYFSDKSPSLKVEDIKKQNGKLTIKLLEVDDRNKADRYRDKEIFVYEKHLPLLIEGEFYWYQLEKLKVVNEKNEVLGIIDHLMETGANDVLVVKPLPESIDDNERLIPFTQDIVINKVDLKRKTLYVKWPKDY